MVVDWLWPTREHFNRGHASYPNPVPTRLLEANLQEAAKPELIPLHCRSCNQVVGKFTLELQGDVSALCVTCRQQRGALALADTSGGLSQTGETGLAVVASAMTTATSKPACRPRWYRPFSWHDHIMVGATTDWTAMTCRHCNKRWYQSCTRSGYRYDQNPAWLAYESDNPYGKKYSGFWKLM